MNYNEALEYISNINWKFTDPGLDRIRELLNLMGNPQKGMKFIHVGGTNGKGSTCAFLSSILVRAGYKVGLFISPFIEVFNERMQINNVNISDDDLAEITTYIQPFADSMADPPTEFELNTAIGLEYFKRNACDIVILEVGMGGELDSTNIIESPELAIITTISLDHTQYLGDTLEKIAKTKSGIIKSGCNVVLYKQGEAVTEVIRDRCAAVGAKLHISEPERLEFKSGDADHQMFQRQDIGVMGISLAGRYQIENAAVVIKAVEVLRELGYNISNGNLVQGFEDTRWPGRFEVICSEPTFIVDGGHNPQGIHATCETLKSVYGDEKIVMIFGVLADKDYMQMINDVLPLAGQIFTVTPPSKRALPAEKLAGIFQEMGVKAKACESIEKAIEEAFICAGHFHPICALGSLYMIGDIKKLVAEYKAYKGR